MPYDIDALFEIVESEAAGSERYATALEQLEQMADAGSVEAAETIAEVFAFSSGHRDPAKAYFWYHVTLATRGYSTSFENQHDRIEQYCGPVGDFRNEGQVNELVGEIGEFRVRQLDILAAEWLRNHSAG